MNFSCSSCHKTYTIPDGKLPSAKKLAFPCPDCGHRIELNLCDHRIRRYSDGGENRCCGSTGSVASG